MIKCFLLIRRAPHLSREAFEDYWLGTHGPLAASTSPGFAIRRYVQNHRREHPLVDRFRHSRGALAADFDGIAEVWWDSFDSLAAAAADRPADIAAMILADERRFIDLERSIIWFGEEFPIFP